LVNLEDHQPEPGTFPASQQDAFAAMARRIEVAEILKLLQGSLRSWTRLGRFSVSFAG
jgi:hypothetical protein